MATAQQYEYAWRWGFQIDKTVDPQSVGQWMEDVAARNGGKLDPQAIVKAARVKSAPVHAFIWGLDETQAAYAHRIERANYMMRAISIRIADSGPDETVRAYHVTTKDNSKAYRAVTEIVNDKEQMLQLQNRAIDELQAWARRWGPLLSASGRAACAVVLSRLGVDWTRRRRGTEAA